METAHRPFHVTLPETDMAGAHFRLLPYSYGACASPPIPFIAEAAGTFAS
ncbi:hypothetical protein GDO78_020977 [Eleutherodactylus coqui]|uniref:Uncharacterized protein n=1 Tax=Eleutherodactylus coqui TaxID=57060 RepID=A0A8J6JZ25_ELECQ|nr:hypothetical protein GDO78_020977 [Eleutherodactylus coqui]